MFLKNVITKILSKKSERRLKGNVNSNAFKNSGKAQPSGTPFFIMREMNWSCHMRFETDCKEYYVYLDRRVESQYNGYIYELSLEKILTTTADDYWSGLKTKKMKRMDFLTLCNLLKKFPEIHTTAGGCDGTGYEMTMYDNEGNITHTICGYIYGNDILEKIKNLITKY